MEKPTLLHPRFFHTLAPSFHTHLMIPLEFFSEYIKGRNLENKTTAKVKSDTSDITWTVKMTGRRLSDGWRDFAVANNLQLGNVVVVSYEGDMVFHVSDLGPSCCSSCKAGSFLLRKHRRTDISDVEVPLKKKVKTNINVAETDPSSLDKSCFVATVTDSSLHTDTLHLPQHFTSSNGLTRKCHEIVLTDGEGKSWALDLSFNELFDTFYMTRGWRNFCDENGQEAGGFLTFKLVRNGEIPVLSFCPTDSMDSRIQRDCSEVHSTELSNEDEDIERERNEDEMDIEKKFKPKRRAGSYSSYSPRYKRFVTFTLPPDYVSISKLTLPKLFVRENGINKAGEIYLLGKDGTKWLTRLLLDKKGPMRLGNGWKEFVKANGVESGFTLKLIWEDTTPALSLCCAESTSDREQEEYLEVIKKQTLSIYRRFRDISKDENNKEERRSWEREKNHLRGRDSSVSSQNELLRCIQEKSKEGDNTEENNKEESSLWARQRNHLKCIDSTSPSQNRFRTITIRPGNLKKNRMCLPTQFVMENCLNKPGIIYLLGKDGTKWTANLVREKDGRMTLGNGWKVFAKANDLKPGESLTLESIWEDETPMLRFFSTTESNSSKANKKESISAEDTEPRTRDSSSAIQDSRFMTLTLTPEDVKACMLHLSRKFIEGSGINKLGKITIVGENKMELSAYLLSRDGIVALETGWVEFCEANGVKLGESFTLEFINEQDKTAPVLKFCSRETNKYKYVS